MENPNNNGDASVAAAKDNSHLVKIGYSAARPDGHANEHRELALGGPNNPPKFELTQSGTTDRPTAATAESRQSVSERFAKFNTERAATYSPPVTVSELRVGAPAQPAAQGNRATPGRTDAAQPATKPYTPQPRREIVITPSERTKPPVKPTEKTLAQKRADFKANGPDHYETKDYLKAQQMAKDLKLPFVVVISGDKDKQTVLTGFEKKQDVKGKAVFLRITGAEAQKEDGGMAAIAKALNFTVEKGKGTPHVIAFSKAGEEVLDKRPPFGPDFVTTLSKKLGITDQKPGPGPRPKPGPRPRPGPGP